MKFLSTMELSGVTQLVAVPATRKIRKKKKQEREEDGANNNSKNMNKQIALLCKRRCEFTADSTDLLF